MEGRPSGPHLPETGPKDNHANAFYAAVDACGLEQGPTCFTLGTPAPNGSSHVAQGRHSVGRSGGSGRRPLQQRRVSGSSARTRPLPTNSPSSTPLEIPAPTDFVSFAAAAAEGGVFRGFSAALDQPPVFTGAWPPATTAPATAVAAAASAAAAATAGGNACDPDESSTSPIRNIVASFAAADTVDTAAVDTPRRGALDELISLLLLDDHGPGVVEADVKVAPQQDSDAPGGGQFAAGSDRASLVTLDDPWVVRGSAGHGSGPSHVSSPAVGGMYGKDGQEQVQAGIAVDDDVPEPASPTIPAAMQLGLTVGGAGAGAGAQTGSGPGGAALGDHRSSAAGALSESLSGDQTPCTSPPRPTSA